MPPEELAPIGKQESVSGVKQLSVMIGDKPGPIDNSEIEGRNEGELKQNLIVNSDFVLLPEQTWKLLHGWYGGGPEFRRNVILNAQGKSIIELYPPLVTSIFCGNDGHPMRGSEKNTFMSAGNKLLEV